jgi:uncharacterized protein
MTNGTSPPTPATDLARRIASLDVLRGLALLGMFVVHFHERSSAPGGFDDTVRTLIWRLVESKSHGTFALLFGAGFALQLRRAEGSVATFVEGYLRRLAVLACFGFAAHAFFGFNVLLGYAAWGVALLVVRTWSTRALLATAVVCAGSLSLYQLAATSYLRIARGPDAVAAIADARTAVAMEVNGSVRSAVAQDNYRNLVSARLRHMAWFYTQPFFFLPGLTLTLFIAGFLFVRHGVFEHPHAQRRLLTVLTLFGVISWVADNWILPTTFGLLRDQWLTFTYVSIALLLFAHVPALVPALRAVGNAGRMALTNYVIQIAALDLMFSGYALGLGQVRPIVGLAGALTCFAVEVVLSTIWLARFRFGPAEWLWRSLTHGSIQPMRRISVPIGRNSSADQCATESLRDETS